MIRHPDHLTVTGGRRAYRDSTHSSPALWIGHTFEVMPPLDTGPPGITDKTTEEFKRLLRDRTAEEFNGQVPSWNYP